MCLQSTGFGAERLVVGRRERSLPGEWHLYNGFDNGYGSDVPLAGRLHDLVSRDDRLYVARGRLGSTVIDVSESTLQVEQFSFGGGPEAVKLGGRGLSLAVTHADGSSTAYDLSQLDAPRRLPAQLSLPGHRSSHQTQLRSMRVILPLKNSTAAEA